MSDQANEVPASNVFEAELGRQIVASERERASLQAAIGVALLLIVGVVSIAEANPLPAFTSALLVRSISLGLPVLGSMTSLRGASN